MGYDELSLNGFIKEVKEVSTGPHPRSFCFVLGAGASKSSGIKSGQDLVDIWEKELTERNAEEHDKWKQRLGITEENKYSFYSKYYERRFGKQPSDGYNYLEKQMEHVNPSIGYVMLSFLLTQKEYKHNVVITTNFDHLTEDAVNYYAQMLPLVIGHESLAHYISHQLTRPTIIKIHRDLLFDPKNRTDEVEVLHKNWEDALSIIFSQYNPIFIGYAGNDNSLMNFLNKNAEKFASKEWKLPYWILYKDEKPSEQVVTFLNNADGYLIRGQGFDNVMCQLAAEFSYVFPTKDDFLSDAGKRYDKLSGAMDQFTEESRKEKQGEDAETVTDNNEKALDMDQAMQQILSKADLQRMYRESVQLYNAEKYEEAVKILKELIKQEPDNARYHDNLSNSLHMMKDYEAALEEAQIAVRMEPENARYLNGLGVTLHELERYEDAVEFFKKAIEFDPENAGYHDGLSTALHAMKQYEEALSEVEIAVGLEPDEESFHYSLALTLKAMKRYEEAAAAVNEALKLDPDNAEYKETLEKINSAMKESDSKPKDN